MSQKKSLITGVDIGSHAVKICQLKNQGESFSLVALGSALLPPGAVEDGVLQDPEAVGEVVASLFDHLKIKNRRVGISISGYSVIVKKITLDPLNEVELAKYIDEEAEQYIPFDIDDVYLDYQDLHTNTDENPRTEIMLVAAKKEVVDDYLGMIDALKLVPVLVDVDGFALENIWEITAEELENVVLVDIGASKMNINIISGGTSVLARDIVVGSEQLTEQIADSLGIEYDEAEKIKLGVVSAEEHREQLSEIFNHTCIQWVMEIKKAIDLYANNFPDKLLRRLMLSGGGAKVAGLAEFIQQETGLKVALFNPFVGMETNPKKIDPEYIQAIAPEMAIAAGLAIRQTPF